MTEMELGRDRLRRIIRVIDVRCCYCAGKNAKEKIYIQQQRSERMMTNTGTSPAIKLMDTELVQFLAELFCDILFEERGGIRHAGRGKRGVRCKFHLGGRLEALANAPQRKLPQTLLC